MNEGFDARAIIFSTSGDVYDFFALTTRGLEAISADEIAALGNAGVTQIGYRRVAVSCAVPLVSMLNLRTVDDVFLDVGTWSGVGRPRSTLGLLTLFSGRLDLTDAAAACATVRPIRSPPSFSVTANFVGKRNYNTEEMKHACAEGIIASHAGWTYERDDAAADLNLRIFVEHELAHVGVRLGKYPLHRRPYKQHHVPGSLKPPVAAALLSLAKVNPGTRVLDPCCGGGTVLIEAALSEALAVGGDSDVMALAAAAANARAAAVSIPIQVWDAQALPAADASMDHIVCNLPWGREVSVDVALESLYRRICKELCRVLAPGGQITLLTNAPHLVKLSGLQHEQSIEISLFGQTPTILVFS
jgi:23S rRNA G2445 N2-methylase RlmL